MRTRRGTGHTQPSSRAIAAVARERPSATAELTAALAPRVVLEAGRRRRMAGGPGRGTTPLPLRPSMLTKRRGCGCHDTGLGHPLPSHPVLQGQLPTARPSCCL